jgi:hypothetical protein
MNFCRQPRRADFLRWLGALTAMAVVSVFVAWLWPADLAHNATVVAVSIWYFGPVYFQIPLFVFSSFAAVIFAVGCCLRWPPAMARQSPVWRGTALLTVVFVLHGAWLQFGWVPFRPLCTSSHGPFAWNPHRALIGPLTPEAAAWFVKTNEGWWGDGTARLSGTDRVLVRPAIALFDNEVNWNFTSKVARWIAEDEGLPLPNDHASDLCSEVEPLLMAGARADERAIGWGTWPWRTFDEDGAVVDWLRDQAD